jgi:hypothetical protein
VPQPAVSSVEEFSTSAALSFSFYPCFIFLLHLLFYIIILDLEHWFTQQQVPTCEHLFNLAFCYEVDLSSHHIFPSKLHLLLSRTDLTLHSPHALLIITWTPVAACSVSRTLVRVGGKTLERVCAPTFNLAFCFY